MPSSHTFTAPGKLVLAGEYAVLEGYEAISCSVSKRVRVKTTLGLKKAISSYGVIGCVKAEFLARGFRIPKLALEADSSELYLESQIKIGIGSSAAVAVATTAALLQALSIAFDSPLCLEIAQSAHRRYTNQRGSGIDVATSFYGGLIGYLRDVKTGNSILTRQTSHFEHLNLLVVHTGRKQKTEPFLEQVSKAKSQVPQSYHECLFGISKAAKHIGDVLWTNDQVSFTTLCEAVTNHNYWMIQLGNLSGLDIFTEEHAQIASIATKFGGVAKPSGAGGGDISICFVEPHHHPQLTKELENIGFSKLDVSFCVPGVECLS